MSSLRTSVRYNRISRDFEAIVDGAVVGHAGTYSAGQDLAEAFIAAEEAAAQQALIELERAAGVMEAQPVTRHTLIQTREQALAAVIAQLHTKRGQAAQAGDSAAMQRIDQRERLAQAEWGRMNRTARQAA